MPSVNPIIAWVTSAPRNVPVSTVGVRAVLTCGAAASASAAAMPAFTVVGIMRVLNGGDDEQPGGGAHQREANAVTTTGLSGNVMGLDRDRSAT